MNDWPIPSVRNFKWKILSTLALQSVAATSKLWLKYLNSFKCHNVETLLKLIENREPGRALITVANHDSCLDDPLVVSGPLPLRLFRSEKSRWSLGAKEICHTTNFTTKFFSLGQVIPIIRGDGIYQKAMNFALDELKKGCWLHIFPEGKVNEQKEIIRYKWGVGRLIMDLELPPIVLPYYHLGMDDLLPNKSPYRPQIGQKVTLYIGTPISFDDLLKKLKEEQKSADEIRKIITDKIQEEMYKIKAIAEEFHKKHLTGN